MLFVPRARRCRRHGERSYMTLLFYLNDGYRGAFTTFHTFSDQGAPVAAPVPPHTGMVLIHQHDIDHSVPVSAPPCYSNSNTPPANSCATPPATCSSSTITTSTSVGHPAPST